MVPVVGLAARVVRVVDGHDCKRERGAGDDDLVPEALQFGRPEAGEDSAVGMP